MIISLQTTSAAAPLVAPQSTSAAKKDMVVYDAWEDMYVEIEQEKKQLDTNFFVY